MTVSRILARCKLDLVGLQVRWEGASTESAREYAFLYAEGNECSWRQVAWVRNPQPHFI
jgi:hypothetical protein